MILIDNLAREADRLSFLCDHEDIDTHVLMNSIDDIRSMAQHMLTVLQSLEYWFDTDEEILAAMSEDERADNQRQLSLIRSAIAHAKQGYRA